MPRLAWPWRRLPRATPRNPDSAPPPDVGTKVAESPYATVVTVGSIMRTVSALCWVLATSGCLISEPINQAPTVTIIAPDHIYRAQPATFRAQVADPDGVDDVSETTVAWSVLLTPCESATEDLWRAVRPEIGATLIMRPVGREGFCLRAQVRDRHGAEGRSPVLGRIPENKTPVATLTLSPKAPASGIYPLYSQIRLSAEGSRDDDGDVLGYSWTATDATMADVALDACDDSGSQKNLVRCLNLTTPGQFTVTVVVAETNVPSGTAAATTSATTTIVVADDQPPCLVLSQIEPNPESLPLVILPSEGRRRFSIRQVKDDGHPLPAGPRGEPTFLWSVWESSRWEALPGDRAEYDMGAYLFSDVRPGRSVRVAVQVFDPVHAKKQAAIETACKDKDLCEDPVGCVRRVAWTLRFQ